MSLLAQIHTLSSSLLRASIRTHSTASSSRFMKDFVATKEKGPVQTSIEDKITEAFEPTVLDLVNESHLHSHHAAMQGNTNKETHFRVTVVSESFQGKSLMQRHRMIYSLLSDELQNKGLHALTLKTKTQSEIEKGK